VQQWLREQDMVLRRRAARDWTQEVTPAAINKNITFMSHDEYSATRTREEPALETVQSVTQRANAGLTSRTMSMLRLAALVRLGCDVLRVLAAVDQSLVVLTS
jgi:hypothetical protein